MSEKIEIIHFNGDSRSKEILDGLVKNLQVKVNLKRFSKISEFEAALKEESFPLIFIYSETGNLSLLSLLLIAKRLQPVSLIVILFQDSIRENIEVFLQFGAYDFISLDEPNKIIDLINHYNDLFSTQKEML